MGASLRETGSHASHGANKLSPPVGFDPARDYEAWRPALIAFYRAECSFQSADNLERFKFPLNMADRRVIDALKAAAEAMAA